jgi:FkbM family methyltransferase
MQIKLKFPKLTGPLRSYYNYSLGEKEISFIYKYLKNYGKNFIFIDVGANYGIFTFLFTKLAKQSYVIEPIKECIEYIQSGISRKSVNFINKVASNNTKNLTLNTPIVSGTKIYGQSSVSNEFNQYVKTEVESFKIDELESQISSHKFQLIFLKIDVEGHELQVLEGAKNLISNNKCILLIEVEKRHNKDYLKVFELLRNIGFTSFYVNKNSLISIHNKNINKVMDSNNNYVFKNY